MFGYFFVSSAVGAMINEILRTEWGSVLIAAKLMRFLWSDFFGVRQVEGALPAVVSVAALAVTSLRVPRHAGAPRARVRGGALMSEAARILLDDVSKFYGEVLGVNRISMTIGPGITSLVGPNGAGKTTLLNLITGLIRPTQGQHRRHRRAASATAETIFALVGYCTQYDAFPRGLTGLDFVRGYLTVHGVDRRRAHELACEAIETVGLLDAADAQDRRLQQGDAAAAQARPGARPPARAW